MSTDDRADHTRWDELAAGHALHALEPEEEAEFNAHAAGCADCRAALDDHALVAAQLASLADENAGAPPPWSRIRPSLTASPAAPPGEDSDASVTELARRPSPRRSRVLAIAAAVGALPAIGVTGWQLAGRDDNPSVPSAVTSCRTLPDCHVVALLADGKVEAGDVVVRDGSARVVPTAMPPLDASHVYVLWQLPRGGRPTPVTVLSDVRNRQATPAKSLALPYDDTAAFAMSVERADRVPTQPTKVVALGNAT